MTGDAVPKAVLSALESLGTPNLLLQTDLTQVPTISISPTVLPPALLYEGSFGVAATQTITLANSANTSVTFNVRGTALGFSWCFPFVWARQGAFACWEQVSITPRGALGGWVAAVPMAGTVAPGAVTAIKLNYDISQNEFQGINTADILLTTTARPLAKARPA